MSKRFAGLCSRAGLTALMCALAVMCAVSGARAVENLQVLKDLPLLDKRGNWRETLEDLQTQGVPQHWTLLGPISNENAKSFDKVLEPDLSDDWSKPMTDNLGRLLRVSTWSKPKEDEGCYVDLNDIFSNPPPSPLAFALSVIESPIDGPALLWFESAGRVVVNFNNKEVLSATGKKARLEGVYSALFPLPIELRRGRNYLKIKILKDRRTQEKLKGWGFFARVERNDLDWHKQLLVKLKELYPEEDMAQSGAEARLQLARSFEKSNALDESVAAYQNVLDRFGTFEDLCDEARDALKRLTGKGPKDDPLQAGQAWSTAEERFKTALNAGQTLAADRIMRDFTARYPFSVEAGLALCNRGGLRLDYACDELALPFYERAMNEFSRNETVRTLGVRGMEFARLYRPERGQLETNRQAETALAGIQRQLRNGNEKDNAAGLKSLGELLVSQPGALIRAGGPELYPRCASLTVLTREFLASLTPEERKLLGEPMARAADALYRHAAAMNDAPALEEVARRYPGAEASAKALNHAGNLYLDHGLYARAAQAFRTLLRDFKGSGLLDDALAAAKEIRALEGAGQSQAAREALGALQKEFAASKIGIGGRELPVAEFAAESEARLAAFAGPAKAQTRSEAETFASNSRRLGAALNSPMPLPGDVAWTYPLRRSDAVDRARSAWNEDRLYQHIEPFPVASGNRVFFATRETVCAIDLASGKEAWEKRWGNAGSYALADRFTGYPQTIPVFKEGKLFVRVISSDRNSVLRCYNADTGNVDWDSEKTPGLRPLMWNSEPLAAYNLIYASYFEAVDHDMVRCGIAALDARSGALVWKRAFGVGNSGVRVADRNRDPRSMMTNYRTTLQLGPPAAHEGVVYASTGLGSLAALNAYTGEILWLTEYPRLRAGNLNEGNSGITPFAPRMYKVLSRGPASPVVGDEIVALAPRDAAGITAFDRRTGEMRWARELFDARFIAGVCNGKLLAADDTVSALDLSTGKVEWEFSGEGKRLVGQPGNSGGALYLPYEDALYVIDAKNGKQLSRNVWSKRTDGAMVNMIVVGSQIIGVNGTTMSAIKAK